MKRICRVYGVAVVAMMLGVSFQWWLLSGSSPWSVLTALRNGGGTRQSVVLSSKVQRPNFQTGVVFPRWGATAYSTQDANWPIGLQEIADQTSAQWLELT